MIRDVRFHGSVSKNGYGYGDRGMQDIKQLYEMVDVSYNHGATKVETLAGYPRNLRIEEKNGISEIRGDFHSLEEDPHLKKKIFRTAREAPHLLKFSHEIPEGKYRMSKKNGKKIIESVQEVRRIALIIGKGGVNNTLFENKTEEPEMDIKTTRDLKNEFPTICEAFLEESRDEILESCACQMPETGSIAQLAKLQTQLNEKDEVIRDLEAKLGVFTAKERLEERKQEFRDLAKEMKRELKDNILESLLNFADNESALDHARGIIESQPELKEVVDDEEGESSKTKVTQEGSKINRKRNLNSFANRPSNRLRRALN